MLTMIMRKPLGTNVDVDAAVKRARGSQGVEVINSSHSSIIVRCSDEALGGLRANFSDWKFSQAPVAT